MNKIIFLVTIVLTLLNSSCKKEDPLLSPDHQNMEQIMETETLLQNNVWGFNDLIVEVKYEMRAIPMLANVADENGMVQPGIYNSQAIFGNDHRQRNFSYQFVNSKVYRDTANQDAYNQIGRYSVRSLNRFILNPDSSVAVEFNYNYQESDGIFVMTTDQLSRGKMNEALNNMIANSILTGKPDDISNAFVDKLLANEKVQAAIQQLLYDMIHGKVEFLTQNPEEISQMLATIILQKLKEVDWETLVYNKLVELLQELNETSPQQKAQQLATQIANRIETNISQEDIYNAILPVLQQFEYETLPVLAPALAQAISNVILAVFSEENIYEKIYPIWVNFSEADASTIAPLADTLGTVITNYFIDTADLSTALEPLMQTLRTTPTYQIPALAQDIIDNKLIPLVDTINANFPGLNLNPDWNNVKTLLTSALTVIKSSITNLTNAEAADELSVIIKGIMDEVITKGVEKAIFQLQGIPADQASQVIAAWINNLLTMAQPQIVNYLTVKLNELAELFNAEEVADEIATKIHDKILEVFSASNIYDLILPILENLSEMDEEAVAEKIADWLTDLDLIEDNVSEEDLLAALTTIISDHIGNINVDEATQKIVDAILQSDIVVNMDGNIFKQLFELKIYEFLIEVEKNINAIEKFEVRIIRG